MYILKVGFPVSMLEKRLGISLQQCTYIDHCTYLGFGLLEAPREHVLHGPFLGIYWLRLFPHFGAPMLEATLLWRRLFIVLMTTAHISPNVFSLQLSLASVYWTSYYYIQQCTHTYYTSHSHNLTLYYIILHDTLTSILHLHFFCSSSQAGCSRVIASDTLLITCNKYSHNEIIEHIYFKYFITGSKVISIQHYSDNATLHIALSHNALSQHSKVIISKRYCSWYIGTIIAS